MRAKATPPVWRGPAARNMRAWPGARAVALISAANARPTSCFRADGRTNSRFILQVPGDIFGKHGADGVGIGFGADMSEQPHVVAPSKMNLV